MAEYDKTLNLPATDFPMRADLPNREPAILQKIQNSGLYELLMERNQGKPLFILHDGPPYANGSMHIGTSLNKSLKDFILRYHNMAGYQAPYIPGWDTHGLPIELKARAKAGVENAANVSPVELRSLCRAFALESLDIQRNQFKRLGVVGDWANPYITMDPAFEADQIMVFAEMASKGYIYKGLKPVYWCPECQTALAEFEIEYADDPCYSVYVAFPVDDDKGILRQAGIPVAQCSFVIWTTTTWTLPGNVAICLGPDFDYAVVSAGGRYLIMAQALVAETMKNIGTEDYTVAAVFKGHELAHMTARHPFLDRASLVITGSHVTTESGTGCVHTAPGHGVDDYVVCKDYPHLGIPVPVDHAGCMLPEAGEICVGMRTGDASKAIALHMKESGALLGTKKLIHSYPHCWRCKEPVLFRATEQWFCSIDDLKETALQEVQKIRWIPGWGGDRMAAMIRDRNDWCISRQRLWGVPIPVFYCAECGKEILDKTFIAAVSDLFRRESSDAWYTHTADEMVPPDARCPHCGHDHFTKENDIMDVWFDSGSSHAHVCANRPGMRWPADVYLEGGDQFRGWFQSSLLTATACKGSAPYRSVITHGWTVDGAGRKMSKSLGNGIEPDEIIGAYGADILRLWVASLDYKVDARLSKDILKQLSEAYRKIRNTARFILGNIHDFDPAADAVPAHALEAVDRWALAELDLLTEKVHNAYRSYEFHDAYYAIHHFCVVEMSNFYLDVIKDRLYVERTDSLTRRGAQTAIYAVLRGLTLMIAPILAFTSEEIWTYMPHLPGDRTESVLLNDMPTPSAVRETQPFMAEWKQLLALREDTQKALELARTAKVIGGSLEARVTLHADGAMADFIQAHLPALPALFIVSQVELSDKVGDFTGEVEGLSITIGRAHGEKCIRCWGYSTTVGGSEAHPQLCARCAAIL